MSDRGSPSDHAATDTPQPADDAPASASPQDAGQSGGDDAKSPADDPSPSADKGAKKDDDKPSLLDVLKSAAELPDVDGKSPDPAKSGKDTVDPAHRDDAPDAGEKADAPDDTKLSFHNHPRWQEVIGQNKQYREQVKALEPDADQFRKINSFMQEHHLTPNEVGDSFILAAMMKNGDARALQKLDELRSNFALAIGEALPADIQDRIDAGEISETAGSELAKSRAANKLAETREAARQEEQRVAEATRTQSALANAQASAVQAWDVDTRKVDPDFAKKENAIGMYARGLMQEHGLPKSPAEAVQLMKAAYAKVNKDFAQALPPKTAVARLPVAPSSNGAKAAPKSLREALERAAAM